MGAIIEFLLVVAGVFALNLAFAWPLDRALYGDDSERAPKSGRS